MVEVIMELLLQQLILEHYHFESDGGSGLGYETVR
jgi:hypothetical protein